MTAVEDLERGAIRPVQWRDGALVLLDQRRLPAREEYLRIDSVDDAVVAIRDMVVRGAPAIGIAAAYAVVLAARAAYRQSPGQWLTAIDEPLKRLAAARPTAVNLGWAVARMQSRCIGIDGDPEPVLLAEAQALHAADIVANRRMGEIGAACIKPGSTVLTHCNAGALATGGYGTALGVIRTAHTHGLLKAVYAGETRPWLQGARLTAWELLRDGIAVTLLADGAAAYLMATIGVDWVIVGADRIAANGDVANKIGTYSLALAARAHGARFMVVAPTSTFDPAARSGSDVPVECRSPDEVLQSGGYRVAATGADAWNPVFDVTPAALIDVIVTEHGAIERPCTETIAAVSGVTS
jgi:methylthioribose-1-phosphate isomerase